MKPSKQFNWKPFVAKEARCNCCKRDIIGAIYLIGNSRLCKACYYTDPDRNDI